TLTAIPDPKVKQTGQAQKQEGIAVGQRREPGLVVAAVAVADRGCSRQQAKQRLVGGPKRLEGDAGPLEMLLPFDVAMKGFGQAEPGRRHQKEGTGAGKESSQATPLPSDQHGGNEKDRQNLEEASGRQQQARPGLASAAQAICPTVTENGQPDADLSKAHVPDKVIREQHSRDGQDEPGTVSA